MLKPQGAGALYFDTALTFGGIDRKISVEKMVKQGMCYPETRYPESEYIM